MGLQAQRSSGTSPQHPDSAPPPRKMCSTQSSLTQSAVKNKWRKNTVFPFKRGTGTGIFLPTSDRDRNKAGSTPPAYRFLLMCMRRLGQCYYKEQLTAPVGTMSDSVSSCTFAVNWVSPQVYSCYFSNIKTQTLPAKQQNQNYTWLSSTSTTTITVPLASVPAGGLTNVPNAPRSGEHPKSPQSAQLERNITSKTESWMPFFVGTELCSDETFAATKARYSVLHKIQERLQRANLVQCSHSASLPGVP